MDYKSEDYQEIFEDYLFSKHPHENDATRNWRESQNKRKIQRAPTWFWAAMTIISFITLAILILTK